MIKLYKSNDFNVLTLLLMSKTIFVAEKGIVTFRKRIEWSDVSCILIAKENFPSCSLLILQ